MIRAYKIEIGFSEHIHKLCSILLWDIFICMSKVDMIKPRIDNKPSKYYV